MWQAIKRGLSDAIRFPAPLAILFAMYFVGALIITLPIFSELNQTFSLSRRLAASDLARTFDVMTLVEPSTSALAVSGGELGGDIGAEGQAASPDPAAVFTGLLVSAAMLLGAALALAQLAALPGALVGGGALQIYADGRFMWRRFVWGCWHWALPFVALLILFGMLAALIALSSLAAIAALWAMGAGAWAMLVLLPVLAFYLAAAALFDYAYVIAVSEGRRNVFWALGQAFRFAFGQPLRAFGLYAALLLLGYLLIVVYNQIVSPIVPFNWAVAAIGLQQVFIAARLWARLARWASAMALYRERWAV